MKKPEVIQIWRYDQVPSFLRRLSGKNSTWVALVPGNLARFEAEVLFLQSNSDRHTVIRRMLADGSILFSGWSDDEEL